MKFLFFFNCVAIAVAVAVGSDSITSVDGLGFGGLGVWGFGGFVLDWEWMGLFGRSKG